VTFDEAAPVSDGAILALTCLRWTHLQPGQRILIYGASGSIGTAAVQLAKHLGAHVTAVCGTAGVETVRSLGADDVLDYTREDFVRAGDSYDVVLDAVGKISFNRVRPVLRKGGRFASTDFGPRGQVPALAVLTALASKLGTRQVMLPLPKYRKADVLLLKELIEVGDYRAVIDRRYDLDEAVKATMYVESEQKIGNVVLSVMG
jgi:NADPH:quinone reductase-like Zn-dependent oxidoreductase